MKNHSFISVPKPCHAGWENMSLTEKGRFCSSCQKEVHDFSSASAEEIKAAYTENKGELCGHVPVRILQEEHFANHLQSHHFGHLKKLFFAAVLCFGASLFTVDSAKASTFYKLKLSFFRIAENDTIKVTGEVRDKKTREQLAFVAVIALYHDSLVAKTETDMDGKYTLKIPEKYEKVDVKVGYLGYETKIMKSIGIAPHKQIVVDFDLEENMEMITDGVIIMQNEPVISQDPGPTQKTVKREEYKKMPK
jgi:hypothetical protein